MDDAYALASAAGLLSDPETAAQRAVIKRVALRAFGSPDGVRVITQETIGSRSVSYSDNRGVSSGVFFTAEDRAAMRGRPISGAYSVPLTTPSDHLP